MNNVCLTGRLTKEPQLQTSELGNSFCTFTLAVDSYGKTLFLNCTAFRDRAETMAHTLYKGSLIAINGRLDQRTYENQQGENITVTSIVVEGFDYLEKKKEQPAGQPAKATAEEIYKSESEKDIDDDLPF